VSKVAGSAGAVIMWDSFFGCVQQRGGYDSVGEFHIDTHTKDEQEAQSRTRWRRSRTWKYIEVCLGKPIHQPGGYPRDCKIAIVQIIKAKGNRSELDFLVAMINLRRQTGGRNTWLGAFSVQVLAELDAGCLQQ
jgi:hypothetical protein